ncbi:Hydroxyneurosporene synthase (CrtC) [Bifidobacterium eulemuris]|uniref:Hydroxyneurosporene synthase (CrtC) n=3 Tax=Bifidobacterium eulemuris TaxID=1765219 RepID=A0A261GCS1_9BIFI|nr:Hydroxyneurosporene synthase (CrtC) [Bifidobacterium eulemuris]
MMTTARLMDDPKDYVRLGVNPEHIETWEDGRRSTSAKGMWEWWYFDAILDDGTKVVIQFFTKSGAHLYSGKDHPRFTIKVTLPDGTEYMREPKFQVSEASWGERQCDVRYAAHRFSGDLKDYDIHVEPIDGLGADLHLHSLSKPYRPGSAYFEFGSPDRFYTWFCAVPKGEVSGALTIDGKRVEAHGYGYHDHQWGNVNFLKEWNHWVWARQSFDDCSMLVFDMVANEKMGHARFPIVFIQDENGDLIFENTRNVECEVLEDYHDEVSEKDYPKAIHYVFRNDGVTADYTLRMNEIIECNGRNNLPWIKRTVAGLNGLDPAYTRYSATGDLILTTDDDRMERSGNLIYEFMYPGATYKGLM